MARAADRAFERAWAGVLQNVPGPSRAGLSGALGVGPVAVVALGSYGRRELCPGSDIDVLLIHGPGVPDDALDELTAALWYPFWDAGVVLGHSVLEARTVVRHADADLETLTTLLEARVVTGDADGRRVAESMLGEVRALAPRRRGRLVTELAAASEARRTRPGPVSEMQQPNVKEGAGGLRDLQALAWVGHALGSPGGPLALVTHGYLHTADAAMLVEANTRLLALRCSLHRVNGRAEDVLSHESVDAVAADLGYVDRPGRADAAALRRDLAVTAGSVAWTVADVWDRLRSTEAGPRGRLGRRDQSPAEGVVVRDGRVMVPADRTVDASLVLRAAAVAARRDRPFARETLERFRGVTLDGWSDTDRGAFVEVLSQGRAGLRILEALDHVDALAGLLLEWADVRAVPSRSAYHRYTVGRHLLETVGIAAELLRAPSVDLVESGSGEPRERGESGSGEPRERGESGSGEPGETLDNARAPVLLAALLHDVGKASGGDHSVAGADQARAALVRMGFPAGTVDMTAWLVRHHLRLVEVATRRDLDDPATVAAVRREVPDRAHLHALHLLTVADSRATGPSSWNASKAAIVRRLVLLVDATFGVAPPPVRDPFAGYEALLDADGTRVAWRNEGDDTVCVVAADDRRGLLAVVAGVLTLAGMDIVHASAQSQPSGRALERFFGSDPFGRLDEAGRVAVEDRLRDALAGRFDVAARLSERTRRSPRARTPANGRAGYGAGGNRPAGNGADLTGGGSDEHEATSEVDVAIVPDASADATVVEVRAPDGLGLLARLAAVFPEQGWDVMLAAVSTDGDRALDVFYVRGRDALADPPRMDRLVRALRAAGAAPDRATGPAPSIG